MGLRAPRGSHAIRDFPPSLLGKGGINKARLLPSYTGTSTLFAGIIHIAVRKGIEGTGEISTRSQLCPDVELTGNRQLLYENNTAGPQVPPPRAVRDLGLAMTLLVISAPGEVIKGLYAPPAGQKLCYWTHNSELVDLIKPFSLCL